MRGDILISRALETIDLWAQNGLRAIRFSGGEPTLHPDLPQMCRYAKKLGVKHVAVSSNGSADRKVYESLLDAGVSDFSISLDACCSASGEKMCGVAGAWEKVLRTIELLAKKVYVSVGLVVTQANLKEVRETVLLAHRLGVADIRVIPAAQDDRPLHLDLPQEVLAMHPILAYRSSRFSTGEKVRGLKPSGQRRCRLVLDDMAVMGGQHYPCIIYMRERGSPIGAVGSAMLEERRQWSETHDCAKDTICRSNCLDVCVAYNERAQFYAECA